MSWKRQLVVAITLVVLLISCAFLFKKNIATYAIKNILSSYNLNANLQVSELNIDKIIINNINIEDKVTIPLVSLSWGFWPFQLKSIKTDIKHLDLGIINQIGSLSSNSSTSRSSRYQDYYNRCISMTKLDLDIDIEKLIFRDVIFTTEVAIRKDLESKTANLILKGRSLGLKKHAGEYQLDLSLFCKDEFIEVKTHSLYGRFKFPTEFRKSKTDRLNFVINEGSLRIDLSGKLRFRSKIKLDAKYFTKDDLFKISMSDINLDVGSDLENLSHLQMQIDVKNFRSEAPYKISIENLSLNSEIDTFARSANGRWQTNKLAFEKGKTKWINDVNIYGSYSYKNEVVVADFNINDKYKNISFKDLHASFDRKSSQLKLEIPQKTVFIRLNNKLTNTFPVMSSYIKSASGKVFVDGHVTYLESLQGNLKIAGKNIDLDSEYGKVTGLDIQHRFSDLESFSTGPNQTITVQTFKVGQDFQGLRLKYQVNSMNLIHIQSLSLFQDASQINAKNFTIDPLNKNFKDVPLEIKDLSLERVLTLGLGESVKAKGLLSGNIKFSYVDGKPYGDGVLRANAPGWIQYRRGNIASKAINLSDGPMDILNNYLYNFRFDELDLDISANEKYQLVMKLKTLGRNPDYLEGKPLKLNVNLDQNLLGAIRSLVLSYDLPNKLQEYINKAGKK